MGCKYRFNNKVYNSYQSLIEEFSDGDIQSALAILYSLEHDKQTLLYDKLDKLKKEYKFSANKESPIDDVDINVGKDFTTQTFIDSAYFKVDGKPPMFRIDFDNEYLPIVKEQLINQGYTEQQAEDTIKQRKQNWETIAKDAADAHRIIVSSTSQDDDRHFAGATLNTSLQPVFNQLHDVVNSVEKEVLKKNRGNGAYLLKNLNVSAKLRDQIENIIGHIDYLCVKPDGTLDIYNLAVSIDNESDWAAVKKEKYKYKLAFLKRILAYNGINATDIRVNLIPIKVKYDNQFQNITGIEASKAISYDMKDSQYIMQKYDNIVANFIDSNIEAIDINDEDFNAINTQLARIFPNQSIEVTANGIKESAKGWVKSNWSMIAKPSEEKGWDILFPGQKETVHVDDTRIGENNEQVVAMVTQLEDQLINSTPAQKASYRVVADIQAAYEQGLDSFYCSLKNSSFIQKQLNKYFEFDTRNPDGKPDYKWELIDNNTLTNANILLFKHKVTNQIDVVTITPFDVSTKVKYKGRENLLGSYLTDLNNRNFTMQANYGNIEAIKTLTALNQILPKLPFTPKLGTLKVVGISNLHDKKGCEMDISMLLPHFKTIVDVVKENNSSLSLNNNFEGVETIDPSELMIQTWREALSSHPEVSELKEIEDDITSKTNLDGTVVDGLETTKTVEGKLIKLQTIIDKIENMDRLPKNPRRIKELIYSADKTLSSLAKVYMSALRALNMYNGDLSLENEAFGQMSEYVFKTQSIPNTNVRVTGFMFQQAVNKVADRVLHEYSPLRKVMSNFFEAKGYTALRNSTIGDEVRIFKNLYDPYYLSVGELKFKNPYDEANDLDASEREFLKNVLFEINKIRYEMRGQTWQFTGINDSHLIDSIKNTNYLDVPLERASIATRRTKVKQGFKEFGQRWMKRITHPVDAYNEFMDDTLNEEEKAERKADLENLQAYNPFKRSEDFNRRANWLNEKGLDYFETNVENILIDFIEKHIQSVEYQKMLTRTKGILLDLYLKGETEDDFRNVEHTVKTINDFLSVSVFNQSIMEPQTKAIEALIDPIRRAVSKCYIAGNVAGTVRDTIQGLFENLARSINKYQTDITAAEVLSGYKEVIVEGPQNIMTISKLNQLNLKYRLSNMDIAKISEGQKTCRGGILNWENWAYSTLYGPDYLNRMVLFTAQMKHDGVFDAYYIKDGQLVYDWRRDKRFDLYAKGDRTDEVAYQRQRSLYLSLMRMMNQENGTSLTEGDDLPDAYTQAQITSFKHLADSIYGAYNQSTKAKYENIAIGRNFAIFSTWMNGLIDNYGKSRQISNSSYHAEQETRNGKPLYWNKQGEAVTLEEGGDENAPVVKYVPDMVQGIIYTIADTLKEFHYNGIDGFKENIWNNEVQQANLRKLFSDLLVSLIVAGLFGLVFNPMYKDHKKNADGQNLIGNAITELIYKGGHSAFDGFKGPLAVLDYLGNSTNPATYKLQSKIINDMWNLVTGNKSLTETIMNSQALFRSFQDTYKLWAKAQNQ